MGKYGDDNKMNIYIYIYICIASEREREKERKRRMKERKFWENISCLLHDRNHQ